MSAISVLYETDNYREFNPPATARGAIACIWARRGALAPVRVLPDGCVDIVWRSEQGAVVAGPDTAAWFADTRPGELIVGARLLPGAGGAALGVPLSELCNQRVELSDLSLDRDGRLGNDADPQQAVGLLVRMATALVSDRPPDKVVQAGVGRLLHPDQRVDLLADELGFSERHLRRRFRTAVGYGPKTLQRVLRLRRFLARSVAGTAHSDLAVAALDAGYSDQAHLARECRLLTGLTPRQLITGV
ncbi:MAG: helix-turn-helix transcriptional regulator [Solirubrobacterales bacterium]|nr:helix-turn-helix transcriptional regulator [Solirubrobacterales bacterium]